MDISTYGFCAYMKKTDKGVVYPVHVPINTCQITLDEDNLLKVVPRYGRMAKEKSAEKKIKVFVASEPSYDTRTLTSPMARLLYNYKRLSELSTCYVRTLIPSFQFPFLQNHTTYIMIRLKRNAGWPSRSCFLRTLREMRIASIRPSMPRIPALTRAFPDWRFLLVTLQARTPRSISVSCES